MTTVAWDGETMAADSRTIGDFIEPKPRIKIHLFEDLVIGCAGDVATIETFLLWIKDPEKNPKPEVGGEDAEFSALIWDRKNCTLTSYEDKLVPIDVGAPNAIGSGAQFAMGAMYHGATAKEAVLVASKLDHNTDNNVTTWSEGEQLKS